MPPEQKRYSNYLSKTLFIKGLQCHKSLYLHKYHPELKDEISEDQEARFQTGIDIGIYAQKLFPGGVEISYEGLSLSDQINRTMEEIEKGTENIYEAAFSYDNIFIKVDILHKGNDGWKIYEVKGSTSVKDVYLNDIASQYYVFKGTGLPLSKVFLVYINNQYVRQGDIEVDKLFTIDDQTNIAIEKQEYVIDEIKKMREMLTGEEPDIDIGPYCTDPYECDFYGHCWQHIPEDSVFSIRDRGLDKFGLYRQGIIHIKDVPKHLLSRNQLIQVEGFLEKKNILNKDGVKEFLDLIWYPLCFLDFETTYMVPIPLFDGTRPYQPVPFQYSLHFLENKTAELKHYEYLAPPDIDPRKELIEKLLNEIPENACVLAYNMSFEIRMMRYLKEWYPEYADRIDNIIDHMRDLMVPFRNKDIYRWEMNGSYSIKEVLPALVPELSYKDMDISDGALASNAYMVLRKLENPLEIEKIRNALLEYCKMDTLAMVRILERLYE